jgi:hypothetical protein
MIFEGNGRDVDSKVFKILRLDWGRWPRLFLTFDHAGSFRQARIELPVGSRVAEEAIV